MAITSHWFSLASSGQWQASTGFPINWTTDTIKCALLASTYTPNQDTHQYWSDTTPGTNEITGTGYTAGGVTLASCTVGAVTGSHEIPLKAANASWTTASFTCRYAVVYKSTGTNTTSPLICYVDFGGNETVSSGTFSVQWDATNGVVSLTAS